MTLDSCIDIITSYQVVQERVQEFQEEEETAYAVFKFMNRKEKNLSSDKSTESTFENKRSCKFCGGKHILRKELCPAYRKVCHKCSRKGYFGSVCRMRKEVSHVQVDDVQMVQLHHITEAMKQRQVFATFKVNKNVEVPFQLDTGSTVNILPTKEYIRARADKNFDKLTHTNVVFRMHNGAMEKQKRIVKLTLDCKGHSCQADFLIAKGPVMPILSLASCERLQLVKIIDSDIHMNTQTTTTANSLPAIVKTDKILSQFTDIFGGLGCLERNTALILTLPYIQKYIHHTRLQSLCITPLLQNFTGWMT